MQEIWKDYNKDYQISNFGNVKNKISGQILRGTISKGYVIVHLTINDKSYKKSVHRLVAELFINNPENKPIINHIDGNKQNNIYTNLEWCTQAENMQHASRTGLINTITQGGKKCIQKNLEGNIVRYFNSIREAARAVNGSDEHICNVCKGQRKTAYGYMWEYQ